MMDNEQAQQSQQTEIESVEKRTGEIVQKYEDTAREWRETFQEFEEDFQFKLGDQWSAEDKEKMKKRPIVVLNRLLKTSSV